MALTKLPGFTLDSSSSFTFANATVTANVTAGNVKTDHLLYANGVAWDLGGSYSNTQVAAYLPTYTGDITAGNISATGNITATYLIGNGSQLTGLPASYSNTNVASYLPTYTGNVSANYFIGNGSTLTHITGGNVDGQVSNALVAGTVYTNAQPNITSVGTLSSVSITGLTTATGGVKTANILDASGTITLQTKYNSVSGDVGVVGNLVVGTGGTGNITATYLIGNGSQLTGLPASYSNTNVASYLPTYTGNLTAGNVNVSGSFTTATIVTSGDSGNITGANVISANSFIATSTANFISTSNVSLGAVANVHITGGTSGQYLRTDGSGTLTWADAGNATAIINGTSNVIVYNNGNVATSVNSVSNVVVVTSTGANVTGYFTATGTATAANIVTSGTVTAANIVTSGTSGDITGANNVSANYFTGNGSYLSAIAGGNITGQVGNSLISGTVYTGAQPNITSVGTLVDANVSGNVVVSGNLTVGGTTSYVNVTTLDIKDPIIEIGGASNGAALTTNDGKDRGSLLHYYTTTPVDAFMGWDNSNAEFAFGSNVTLSSEVATFNTFGNVRAGYFLGNGSQLTGVAAATATTAATVTTNAQPNITSVGTLASVSVTGNVSSSGNIIGNGQYLTSITGGNVTGQVANSLVAGTVYTNAQPNITSVGTLASLSVTANITSGNINGGNAVVANYFVGDGSLLTGLPASYSNTNVAAYLPTYSGNLSATNVAFTGSNVSLGAIGNLHITGGSANYVLQTDGSGSLSWTAQTGGSSSTTIAVDNFTGNGVANTYTLSVTPTSVNSVFVNYNGAFVGRGSYSLAGNVITFGSIPANGASIEITTIQGLTIGSGSFTTRTATGDGSTVNYTVTSGATESSVLATLDGVLQTPTTDYTISGSTLTFTTAPYNGAAIQIRELSVASSSGGGASNTSIRAQAMTMGIIFGG